MSDAITRGEITIQPASSLDRARNFAATDPPVNSNHFNRLCERIGHHFTHYRLLPR
jgi:hypothetical protein